MIGYVQTGDDSRHNIQLVGDNPIQNSFDKRNRLSYVFQVPTITKNLISIGQLVERGLQGRLTHREWFVENLSDDSSLLPKVKRMVDYSLWM